MDKIFDKINKFSDIYKLCKSLSTKGKGDLFELITKYIFVVHPNYYNNTKNIWLYAEIPQDLITKFKLPDNDKGIDLLLETTDHKYYAIQSKFRSKPQNTINWTELATFAGQLFVNNFERAILVTNTYDINEEIEKCDKINCVYGDFFDDDNLDQAFFDNIRNYLNKKPIEYIKKTPFLYQTQCIEKTITHFETSDRGYLSLACGTGKTYTCCEIDSKMKNRITIILVPSLYLLSQIYKEWSLEYFKDNKVKFILVGSDAESKEPFLSTNTVEIKNKVSNYLTEKIIIISTYQSCERLKGVLKMADLIIFDEAHKTVGESIFSYAIHDKNIKAKKRLFVTATPKIYEKIGTEDTDDEVVSMNNENLYGKCINTYQIGQAIEEGKLTPYEIHLMYITDEQIKKYREEIVNVDGEIMNFHNIATCMMIKEMFNENTINHLLTYHANIQNSKDFKKLLRDQLDDISIDHMDGTMSAKNKGKLINVFRTNKKGILTSARVLNEGVNIVEVNSVCFVENRNSGINIIQCVGRALRLLAGKTMAKIIIPILEEDIETSKFKDLIKIVKNLGEYDYQVKERIMSENPQRKLIKVGNYRGEQPNNKIAEPINLEKLYGEIKNCIIGGIYSWEKSYTDLIRFFAENNRRPTTCSKNNDEKILGSWIGTQLKNYKKTEGIIKISAYVINGLNS